MILSCWFQLYFSMVPMQINSRIKINFHRKFEFNQISADKSGGGPDLRNIRLFHFSPPINPPRIIHPGDSSGNPRRTRFSTKNPTSWTGGGYFLAGEKIYPRIFNSPGRILRSWIGLLWKHNFAASLKNNNKKDFTVAYVTWTHRQVKNLWTCFGILIKSEFDCKYDVCTCCVRWWKRTANWTPGLIRNLEYT